MGGKRLQGSTGDRWGVYELLAPVTGGLTPVLARCTCCGWTGERTLCYMRKHPLNRCRGRHTVSTHNQSKTPTYQAWKSMHQRCYNPRTAFYKYYGGRGVTVCDRWHGVDGYKNFVIDMGEKPFANAQLDKDIKGDGLCYCPEACQWVTPRDNLTKRQLISKSGERNVYYKRGKYEVVIDGVYLAVFSTLAEAVAFRDKTLQERAQ